MEALCYRCALMACRERQHGIIIGVDVAMMIPAKHPGLLVLLPMLAMIVAVGRSNSPRPSSTRPHRQPRSANLASYPA
jgi:hypothetical protein